MQLRLLKSLFSQQRFIDIDFYKHYISYRIPLYNDLIKKVIKIEIKNNELIINVSREKAATF